MEILQKIYWDKKEVEEVTGIKVATLNRWIFEKINLPFIRTGGKIYYDRKDVEAFMAKNKVSVS